MSDDEAGLSPTDVGDVTFVAADSTTEIPYPTRRIVITPAGELLAADASAEYERHLRFFTLPHPRVAGTAVTMCSCPTSATTATLCSVQLQRAGDFSTWFIGDRVEPDGCVVVILPYDLVFTAAALLCKQCEKADSNAFVEWLEHGDAKRPAMSYKDLDTLLADVPELEKTLRAEGFVPALDAAVTAISDAQTVGDETYHRLSIAKLGDVVRTRYQAALLTSTPKRLVYPAVRPEPKNLCPMVETKKRASGRAAAGGDESEQQQPRAQPAAEPPSLTSDGASSAALGDPQSPAASTSELSPAAPSVAEMPPTATEASATGGDDSYLRLRVLHLFLDYLPKPLHAAMAKQCGVDWEADRTLRVQANRVATNSMLEKEDDAVFGADSTNGGLKKHRSEQLGATAKSASVKKLEKAGAPKGTPNIMAMFAKKAAPAK